jgi:hypothetical protein
MHRRRRWRSELGNTIIEFAFMCLPFFAVIFATIDFAMAVFLRATMQHAVREGARYAVTYQTLTPSTCQDESIKAKVLYAAAGMLRPEQLDDKVKIEYYLPDTLSPTADNSPGNIVEVSIENFQYRWICPLWRSAEPMNITTRSTARMEGLPGGRPKPCR